MGESTTNGPTDWPAQRIARKTCMTSRNEGRSRWNVCDRSGAIWVRIDVAHGLEIAYVQAND